MTTLNQIIDQIKAFGQNHAQLNDAVFCRAHEWLDRQDKRYAVMFFDHTGSRKEKNVLIINWSVWIADRTVEGDGNVAEVWSDSLLIGCDLLAFLDGPENDYVLLDGARFTPFTESTGDSLTGNQIEFSLRLPFPYDRCNIPVKGDGIFTKEQTKEFN